MFHFLGQNKQIVILEHREDDFFVKDIVSKYQDTKHSLRDILNSFSNKGYMVEAISRKAYSLKKETDQSPRTVSVIKLRS